MNALLLALPGAAVLVALEWLVARWLVGAHPDKGREPIAPPAPVQRLSPVRAECEVPRRTSARAALPGRKDPRQLERAA